MGRKPKSQLDQGAGASTATPPAASSTADAPAPESVEFTLDAAELRLRDLYDHAYRESRDPNNPPRERSQWGGHAIRLSGQMTELARDKAEMAQDERLADLAERLEELQTKGPGSAGAADTEPPFDAPETPAPN